METLTKPPLKTTEHLQQKLSALARLLDQTMNDVQVLDSEFQERVLQAAIQTEASFEQQASERLKAAVEEAEHNTRTLVTEDLQMRFTKQMAEAEAIRHEVIEEKVQLNEELERMKQAAAEWESERQQLAADYQRANQILEETKNEHSKAITESDEAAAIALERQMARALERVRSEGATRWDAERAHLVAQRDRAFKSLADLDADHQQALAEVNRSRSELAHERDGLRRQLEQATKTVAQLESERNRFRDECENSRRRLAEVSSEHSRRVAQNDQAKGGASSKGGETSSVIVESINTEVARIEAMVQDISHIIEDPATELSVVIRKNAERAELESYLRGLRFKAGK
jgi:DNA repair exonuclease SbcCD ATPase subunit